jgi:spoIIIJ-associated protein
MDESIAFAKKYLEDVLSFFGFNTEVGVSAEDDVIELSIPSSHLNGFLIGQRGDTLRSLQYLVGSALRNGGHQITRVNIDVAEYKKGKAEVLAHRVGEWAEIVKKSKEPMILHPMNSADRRIVHKVASEAGLVTDSEGEGRDRHVVLRMPVA